jgi:hypothetical protein
VVFPDRIVIAILAIRAHLGVFQHRAWLTSTLQRVEMYAWITLLGIEMVYVAATLGGELVTLLLWRRIADFERRLHEQPDDRYFALYLTPLLLTVPGGVLLSIGTGMVGEEGMSRFTGVVFIVLFAFLVERQLHGDVTRRRPRPVPRARWRRELAELREALKERTELPAGERTRIRRRARTLAALGFRIIEALSTQTWRTAFRAEPRRRQAAIITSIALPVVLAVWPSISHGVTRSTFLGYAILLALALGATAAPVLRWVRVRRTTLEVGRELTEQSRHLLEQLDRIPPPRPGLFRVLRNIVRRFA